MRVKITKTNVYKFDELTEDQKEKAIEKLYDINVYYEWWDSVYDDAETIGLKITSFDIDRGSYCKGNFTIAANEVAQNIFNNHGDMTGTYKTAKSFMEQWQPVFGNYMDENSPGYESRESEEKLLDLESDFLNSLLEDYRIMLQKEYEYLTSKESIIETIQANGYEFDEQGNIA